MVKPRTKRVPDGKPEPDPVEEASQESFPASDLRPRIRDMTLLCERKRSNRQVQARSDGEPTPRCLVREAETDTESVKSVIRPMPEYSVFGVQITSSAQRPEEEDIKLW
jgi:hypothetical protein